MQFYEKLVFLQSLMQVTNRMLAHELRVDPSLVSRLRTGVRGVPRNREYIKVMSSYFARRCASEYQRKALSEMLGIRQCLILNVETLSEILFYWLSEDTGDITRFVRNFDSLNVEYKDEETSAPSNPAVDNIVYYGNDGKRAAIRALFQHLYSFEKPCTVYVMTDESDEWLTENHEFYQAFQSWLMKLANLGFFFCYIAPPVSPVSLAFESLIRWLPVYATGQAAAYFYPRLRDLVHRRTLVVVPGHISLFSNSIAHQTAATATLLTSDNRLIQTYLMQFQEYLSLCRPMLHIYNTSDSLMHCFTRFLALKGSRIQKVSSLSPETAPPELIAYCTEHIIQPNFRKLLNLYHQELAHVDENKEPFEFIDIAYLATAEEVQGGKVPMILSSGSNAAMLCYTPEFYCMHLKNILYLLETCEFYHFIPIGKSSDTCGTFMVREAQKAMFVMPSETQDYPLSVLEISQPEVVQLCQEYLLHLAGRIGYTGKNRIRIINQIKERIGELQE